MLFKIKSNPCILGALPLSYVPLRVIRGALEALVRASSLKDFSVSQKLCALSVSLWNDLSDPVFDGVGLAGFKSRTNAFLLARSALSFLSLFLSFSFFHGLVVWGWGLWTDRVFSLSPGLAQRTSINNNNV